MTGGKDFPGGDPWDGVVFDEEFIKGGRHEPPARTRGAIARYGGRRTSWRQGALLEPVPAARRTRRPRADWRLVAAVVVAVALVWFSIARVPSAPEIPAIAAPSVGPAVATSTVVTSPTTAGSQPPAARAGDVAAQPAQPVKTAGPAIAARTSDVTGVSEFDAVGTCYLDPLPGGEHIELIRVDCTAEHNRELVSHRTATDDADEYPDVHYWQKVVGEACQGDVRAYLNQPPPAWPPGSGASWVYPREDSWAFGDRRVYCMFRSAELVTTSVLDRGAFA